MVAPTHEKGGVRTTGLLEGEVVFITSAASGQGRAHTVASAREDAEIRLRPPKPRKNARSQTSAPRRTDTFDSLVGESLALRRALEVASTVVRRRMPAYIVGERGTGKAHLAEAMAKAMSSDVLVWNCAGPNGLDRKVIQQLQEHLGAGAAAILHADDLTPRSRQLLTEALKPLDNPAAIVTMSCLRDETMALTTALAGVEIEMPPLRSRRDDIPLLVAHFLASAAHGVRTVSPAVLRGLTEADWTGNIAQLKDFIDTAAARCSSDELGTQHLSEQHQRTIARHPLSRLEEAELHQIREELADSGGNRLRAAELLQIGRSTLYRKIESYTRRGFALEL